jgi:hypothetical protein
MPKPLIVLAGNPATWMQIIRNQLEAFDFLEWDAREGYVAALADGLAALILVDAGDSDWRYWVTTPKSSPATRRIPVVLVADIAETRAAALLAGADHVLAHVDIAADPAQVVADYARIPDPDRAARLDHECAEPLPDLAQQGVEKFNSGQYYRQHDLFEELWVETEGPVRDLYRAILQVGVAYYQIERGNYRGALKMLLRSVQWLLILPDECQGVDVRALRDDAARVRAELERLGEARFAEFDHTLIKPVRMIEK